MPTVPSVAELLDGHVTLEVECLDRLYLNAYVPNLQVGGQVVRFLHDHRGMPLASPALFRPIGEAFRAAVAAFARDHGIPVLQFKAADRQLEKVRPYFARATRPGVVAIGVAQEFQWVMTATERDQPGSKTKYFAFRKAERRVTCFYFYIWDRHFGPSFIKLCAYFPYPGKVWLNGHEWAKRQLERKGISFTPLANGFASCADPARLQRICDSLSHRHIQTYFEYWMRRIPTPLGGKDRAAGYWWELSMRQVETSLTLVLDRPLRARAFFESVIRDNLGMGRPEEVRLIFARQIRKTTKGEFKTRVLTDGAQATMSISYKHSRVKQYLKQGRAIRIETTVNGPMDLGVLRRIEHVAELREVARAVNRRLLDVQRVASGPDLAASLFEQVALPYVRDGQRTVALRYGEPRVMALLAACTAFIHQVAGFTNATLRPMVAASWGRPYGPAQMTYDLRRLRQNGLIRRLEGTRTYVMTPEGITVAVFYTKTFDRILRPLHSLGTAAFPLGANLTVRRALTALARTVDDYALREGVAA